MSVIFDHKSKGQLPSSVKSKERPSGNPRKKIETFPGPFHLPNLSIYNSGKDGNKLMRWKWRYARASQQREKTRDILSGDLVYCTCMAMLITMLLFIIRKWLENIKTSSKFYPGTMGKLALNNKIKGSVVYRYNCFYIASHKSCLFSVAVTFK